jgi:PAS domain S-box-containing protein
VKTGSASDWKVRLAFGAALLAILAMGAVSYRSVVVSSDSEMWLAHTYEVVGALEGLLVDVTTIESSARGFAVTGTDSDLDPYRAGASSVAPDAAKLRNLTVDNPAQQRLLPTLEKLADQNTRFAQEIIDLRRAKGLTAAADAMQNGPGTRIMDEFRGAVHAFRDEEQRLLALRSADAARRLHQATTADIVGTVLSALIVAGAGWNVRRDSTRRRLAVEQLAQMESWHRGLVESAPDAIVIADAQGRIVLVNAETERLFGHPRGELMGQAVEILVPARFREGHPRHRQGYTAHPSPRPMGNGRDLYGRRKDNSEFPVEISLKPLDTPQGLYIASAIRDITARKEALDSLRHREAIERRSAELSRSNDELQQFAYVAAHDLQEPLRMVASYTQLLSRRYAGRLDADADEFIAYAVDGAHRMQILIADMLAYCRVGTAGKELRETSSEAALDQAVLNLRGAIEESGAVVTHDPLPTVIADSAQFTQLFQNLVGNAIKYRSAEIPRVHVSVTANAGKEWIFAIRDNGLGIDPQYFEKIFVMFQRLHGREEFSGTGIGLTLCKKIAERHGGRIWVDSELGKGATFHFALPERG